MTMSQFDNGRAPSLEEILAQRNSERSAGQRGPVRPQRLARDFGEEAWNETAPRLAAVDPLAQPPMEFTAPEAAAAPAGHDADHPAGSGASRSRRRRQQRARLAAQRQAAEAAQPVQPEASVAPAEFGPGAHRPVAAGGRTNYPPTSHSDLEGLGIVVAGRESDRLAESLLHLMQEMVYARRQHAEAITEELSWRAEIAKLDAQISRVRTHLEAQSLMSSMHRRSGDYTQYPALRRAESHHPGAGESFG